MRGLGTDTGLIIGKKGTKPSGRSTSLHKTQMLLLWSTEALIEKSSKEAWQIEFTWVYRKGLWRMGG